MVVFTVTSSSDSPSFLYRRILHSKGELSEDRHKQYEEFAMSYQKLLANSQSLADLLDENMPDLPQDKPTPEGKV
jgi:regulator of nonsense transcripts 2